MYDYLVEVKEMKTFKRRLTALQKAKQDDMCRLLGFTFYEGVGVCEGMWGYAPFTVTHDERFIPVCRYRMKYDRWKRYPIEVNCH